MKRLMVALFGGCFESVHISTNDEYFRWTQKRRGYLADAINKWMNPNDT